MAQAQKADFNSLTVSGRIGFSEIVTKKDGTKFLSVTVYSTCSKNGETFNYCFTNSNGLMALFLAGGLPKGREVTLNGHINGIRTTYEAKDGSVRLKQRPEIKLVNVQIFDGGLGRMPQSSEEKANNVGGIVVTVDPAPAYGEATPVEDGVPLF